MKSMTVSAKPHALRVLHGPENIAGMAHVIAASQRRLGILADCISHYNPVFQYPAHYYIDAPRDIVNNIDRVTFMREKFSNYDVYHYYFGVGYSGLNLEDFVKAKNSGKKVFMHFCGCDIRDSKATLKKYKYSMCNDCWPQNCSPNRELALDIAKEYADQIFVSTVDLFDELDGAVWLPQPVDLADYNRARHLFRSNNIHSESSRAKRPFRIAHAPSNSGMKGTPYLVDAVNKLKNSGVNVELVLSQNVSHQEALQRSMTADIAVDQLMNGTYGSYAVEMMALGVPVVAYIRDEWLNRYPSRPPIISADPSNIYDVLYEIINEFEAVEENIKKGLLYVSKYHDSLSVAQKAAGFYSNE